MAAGDVYGPELASNSKFTNGIDDWIASTNSATTTELVATNGTMDIQSAAATGDYGNAVIEVNVKAGLTYSLTIEFVSGANAAGDWDDWIRVGTSNGTADTYQQDIWSALTYADPPTAKQGYNTIEWTQAVDRKYLSVGARNDIFTLVIDNVSLRQIMPPLAGYPKTIDHPTMQILTLGAFTGASPAAEVPSSTGNFAAAKVHGGDSTDWVELDVTYPQLGDNVIPDSKFDIDVANGDAYLGAGTWYCSGAGDWSIADGVASHSGVTTNQMRIQDILIIGRTYQIQYDIVSVTAGGISVDTDGAVTPTRTEVGTYLETLTATNDYLDITPKSGFIGSIDNVIVKPIESTIEVHAQVGTVLKGPIKKILFKNEGANADWAGHIGGVTDGSVRDVYITMHEVKEDV